MLRALEAQRLLDLIALKVMPAAAAGLIAYLHLGQIGYAVVLGGAMLMALQLVERCALPLDLMPAARIALALVAPVLGAMLALVLELGAGDHVALGPLEPSVIGAWLVLALGAWVTVHFQEGRPARVAVIGSPGFASDLAAELGAAGIRGYEVIGWFGAAAPAAHSGGLECLGTLDGVRAAVIARRVELLVWAREETSEQRGGADGGSDPCALIADACLDLPVRMIEANQLYEELLGHVPLGTIDAAWFRYMMHPRFRPTSPLSKRMLRPRGRAAGGDRGAAALLGGGDRDQAHRLGPGALPAATGRRAWAGLLRAQAPDDGDRRRGRRPAVV